MRTRQSHQGRLRIIKHTKASTKQIDKQAVMATEQANITEVVIQVAAEAARGEVQAMAMASVDNNQRAENGEPKLDRPIMRELKFDWSSTDKYAELKNFKIEVKNMFQNYSISQAERAPIIKLAWQERPVTLSNSNSSRARSM